MRRRHLGYCLCHRNENITSTSLSPCCVVGSLPEGGFRVTWFLFCRSCGFLISPDNASCLVSSGLRVICGFGVMSFLVLFFVGRALARQGLGLV